MDEILFAKVAFVIFLFVYGRFIKLFTFVDSYLRGTAYFINSATLLCLAQSGYISGLFVLPRMLQKPGI